VLEALGNIGDFLGGIGVVVTLIYLAGQIRQNTRSIRASAFQAAQRDIADKLDKLADDPELIRVYFDGNRHFESFSKEDRRRYGAFMTGLLRRYETLLDQTRVGNIDSSQWEGVLETLRTVFAHPGARAWWANGKKEFNRDLRSFIDREILDTVPGDPPQSPDR
jgi:hypothetical protein